MEQEPYEGLSVEEHLETLTRTVTIEVKGGMVLNVYASKDLPPISVELIDFDNLQFEPEEEEAHSKELLSRIEKTHNHIF